MGEMVGLITGRVRYLKPAEHPMTQRQGVLQQRRACLSFGNPKGNAACCSGIDVQCINAKSSNNCKDVMKHRSLQRCWEVGNKVLDFHYLLGEQLLKGMWVCIGWISEWKEGIGDVWKGLVGERLCNPHPFPSNYLYISHKSGQNNYSVSYDYCLGV